MNQETDQAKNRWMSEVVLGAVFGGVLLLVSAACVTGLYFEEKPPDWTAVDTGLALAFMGVCASLAIGCLASCSRQPRLQRFGNRCTAFAFSLLAAYLLAICLRPGGDHAEETPTWVTVFESMVLLTIVIGLFLFLSDRRRPGTPANGTDKIRHSLLIIIFWPAMLLLVSPIGALLYVIMAGGTAYLGKWIGGEYSHPVIGAIGLPIGLLLAFLSVAILFALKNKSKQDQNFQTKQ